MSTPQFLCASVKLEQAARYGNINAINLCNILEYHFPMPWARPKESVTYKSFGQSDYPTTDGRVEKPPSTKSQNAYFGGPTAMKRKFGKSIPADEIVMTVKSEVQQIYLAEPIESFERETELRKKQNEVIKDVTEVEPAMRVDPERDGTTIPVDSKRSKRVRTPTPTNTAKPMPETPKSKKRITSKDVAKSDAKCDLDYNPLNLTDTSALDLWKRSMVRMTNATHDDRRICMQHQQSNRTSQKRPKTLGDNHKMDCFVGKISGPEDQKIPCSYVKAVTEHMLVLTGFFTERRKVKGQDGFSDQGFAVSRWSSFLFAVTLQYGVHINKDDFSNFETDHLRGMAALYTDIANCDHLEKVVDVVMQLE